MNSIPLRPVLGITAALICSVSVAGSESTAVYQGSAGEDAQLDARARIIHEHVLTLDSHVDVLVPGAPSEYGPGVKDKADLDELRRGGIDAIALAIAVGPGARTPDGVAAARAEADAKLAVIRRFVQDNSAHVALALTAADVRHIHEQGKLAVIGAPAEIWEKVPQLANLNTWPATVFVGRDGLVKGVHSGFASPASGEFNRQLKQEFTAKIEQLLAQNASAKVADATAPTRTLGSGN